MTAVPVLTETPESRSETTTRLFLERESAEGTERAVIEEDLVRLNMPLARDPSRRFRGRGIADDDLEQVAYVGLVKAVKGFKPDRGHEFVSFAVPTIRGEIRRHFRDLGWTVRPPRSIQETQSKISGCESELYQQLGRAPRPSEIAAHLGISAGARAATQRDRRPPRHRRRAGHRRARRHRLLRAGVAGRTQPGR